MKKYIIPVLVLLLTACQSVPDDLVAEYYNIANAYFDVKDYEQAVFYYSKALEVNNFPHINKIRFNLAIAYIESGRVSEALKLVDVLLEEDPKNLQVLRTKAYGYYLLGDDEKAIDVYDQILDIFEYDTVALLNKARLLKDSKPDAAIEILEELNALAPTSEIAILLGSLYKKEDRREDFLHIYEEAYSRDSQNVDLLSGLAEYFEEEQLFYKSINYYDKLIEIKNYENKKEALFRKAVIQLCELDEAKEGFDTLLKSFDSGFNDMSRIKELSEKPELAENVQLKEYLKLRGFL